MTAPDRTTWTDRTPDALASALPAGIMVPLVNDWHAREIAEFQADRLAESGYVLIHPEYVDEATVERLAWIVKPEDERCSACEESCSGCAEDAAESVRRTLAALADTSAQARHTADEAGGA